MLLREIFEAAGKTAVIIYGRMNPPTIGHKRLMEELKAVASKNTADTIVFLSHTQNKKTDPLTFDQKILYATQMFPGITFAEAENSKTFPAALQHLQNAGYTKVVHLVGSDRLMGFKAIIDAYNGKPDKSGTIPFKFDEYEFVSLDRDPDAEGATGMSASKARALAAAGDVESFKLAIPGDDRLTMALYKDVREGLGIKESVSESPIELDPSDPMDPMIYGHDKANPGKLKYRMLRAAKQFKDIAARVDNASPADWQTIARQFEELKMNVEQIRHALDELSKIRKKGGIRSRGIDAMLDSIREGYGRYWCSTDKKWKTRKSPKQSRKS